MNLFLASELRWPEKGLTVRQQTRFPEEEGTTLTLRAQAPVAMAVNLRIPSWATTRGSVSVNGRKLEGFASPGSYLSLERTWQDGDRIELRLPMSLRAEALKGDNTQQAAMYGPLVLGARLGDAGLTTAMQYDGNTGGTRVAPGGRPSDLPTMVAKLPAGQAAEEARWIEKGAGLTFQTVGQGAPTALIPLHQILGERYGVYWKIEQPMMGYRRG